MRPHSSAIQNHNGSIDSVPAPVNMCFILDIKLSMLKDCPHMIDSSGYGYSCLQVNLIYIKILWMLTLLIFNIAFWLCIASKKRVYVSNALPTPPNLPPHVHLAFCASACELLLDVVCFRTYYMLGEENHDRVFAPKSAC